MVSQEVEFFLRRRFRQIWHLMLLSANTACRFIVDGALRDYRYELIAEQRPHELNGAQLSEICHFG